MWKINQVLLSTLHQPGAELGDGERDKMEGPHRKPSQYEIWGLLWKPGLTISVILTCFSMFIFKIKDCVASISWRHHFLPFNCPLLSMTCLYWLCLDIRVLWTWLACLVKEKSECESYLQKTVIDSNDYGRKNIKICYSTTMFAVVACMEWWGLKRRMHARNPKQEAMCVCNYRSSVKTSTVTLSVHL